MLKATKEAFTKYYSDTHNRSGHGMGGPTGYVFEAFVDYASEKLAKAITDATPNTQATANIHKAFAATYKLNEIFNDCRVECTSTNEAGVMVIMKIRS